MNKTTLNELNKHDWVKIRKTLIGYVILKLKFFKVNTHNIDVIDFVDEIISKTFLGDRKWDPNKVDLNRHLQRNIDSEISNFFKKKATILTSSQDIYDEKFAEIVPEDELGLEDKIIFDETIDEKIKSIKAKLIDDDDAGIVFEYLREGYSYEEIREQLVIDPTELNNILKRLKRKTID